MADSLILDEGAGSPRKEARRLSRVLVSRGREEEREGYFVTREAAVGCEGCAGLREDVTTAGTDIRWHYSYETARRVAYFMQSVYAPSPRQASLSMRRKIS